MPYGPTDALPRRSEEARDEQRRRRRAVLWIGVTAYAVFGGADFGAGFWSLRRRAAATAAGARAS